MPLIFPLHSLTNSHVRLHQASASNIPNPLDRDHTSYVLSFVPSYYPLSMLLPACLSQPLSSTTPTLYRNAPGMHAWPLGASPSPRSPYPFCRPRIANLHGSGLSHMQPHAPITRRATHSSTKPTHSPLARERGGCEMGSWPARGGEVEGEAMSIVTNPSQTPKMAARETFQKLNSATTIKVTTHYGLTPHRPDRASIEPSYSRSTTWPTTLQQQPG